MTALGHARVLAVLVAVSACTLALRIRGITGWFWLLGDQIRDWEIALGSFSELPLVGPATHVGGYTIGPAFYWILWAIRVIVGPWFDNLPHAGGIGQAILQSGVDAVLTVAVWKRTQSLWVALASTTLVATAGYDLCLAPLVWNPVMGSTLAKLAIALVLLDASRVSMPRVATTAAVAWMAVHAYTGAIYVTVSVFAALILEPLLKRDWARTWRYGVAMTLVVVALQTPYLVYRLVHRSDNEAMGAVVDSVTRILSGRDAPVWSASLQGYLGAFNFIQVEPWRTDLASWLLAACGLAVVIRYRRDVALLCMVILPQLMAIAGYSFFLAGLDHYYYLSLMTPAVLTVVLGATSLPSPRLSKAVGVALLLVALAITPARVRFADTLHRMPEYAALVAGSRTLVQDGQPLRSVETEFTLPPTGDPAFLYRVLGGRLDASAPRVGVITAAGGVTYKQVDGSSP